jgi:hypothetical protein
LLFATMILQKKVNLELLLKIYYIIEMVVLFTFGIISMLFEGYNGDSIIYIGSYLIIYHRYLFSTMVAISISLIYLSSLKQLYFLRKNPLPTAIIYFNCKLLELWNQFNPIWSHLRVWNF